MTSLQSHQVVLKEAKLLNEIYRQGIRGSLWLGFVYVLSLPSCNQLNSLSDLQGGGGTIIDNGGDLIFCGSDTNHTVNGLLSTDYVLTRGETPDPFLDDASAYIERLQRLVAEKVPEWSEVFQKYVDSLETDDPRNNRLWRPAEEPLTDLASDDPVREFPAQCLKTVGDEAEPNLYQAVRRRVFVDDTTPKLIFEYDSRLWHQLKSANPLQYSYLVFHEFLWDFAPSGYSNRWINRLFHNPAIEAMTAQEVRRYLSSHGIPADAGGLVGRPSEQLSRLLSRVDEVDGCDSSIRYSQSIFENEERVRVNNGDQLQYSVVTPPMNDRLGAKVCGLAFFFSTRKLGDTAGNVSVELLRGQLPKSGEFGGSGLQQHHWYGLCRAGDCLNRQGDLGLFFSPSENVETTWTIRLSNTSGAPVEVAVPFLMFFGKRR